MELLIEKQNDESTKEKVYFNYMELLQKFD